MTKVALVLAGVCLAALSPVASAPRAEAEIITLPPHERTYASPLGGNLMVGNRDETISRIAPLNQVGTTREAFVSSVAYGQVDGGVGKLRVGYHIGCAVTVGAGTLGGTPDLIIGIDPDTEDQPPLLLNPNPIVTLNLTPGEVAEVAMTEKDMIPGKLIQTVIRDFHLKINTCTGPVSIRQFTYVIATSPEVDDMGAVFGDPTWL
ncbi:MspA family porin [Nocardia sp. NBC_01009]|uniref:MspA family porin n=2 Tax=unclassified Nocardia TaxID=2637762 RepID=UPI00386C19F1|nr:MspA family porin [Nocardia sp. NBC_01009]